jgi:TRAP-type C4-dicarboxylate transport system permease small subunit
MKILDTIIEKLAVLFQRFGSWVLVLMMFLTAGDVFLRNMFNKSILGTFEITECMMVLMVASGLAYVSVAKSQIRVEVLFSRLPQRVQNIFTIITDFLSFGLCSLLSWRAFVNFKGEYVSDTRMGVLLIPTSPFIAVVALGWLLLALVLLNDYVKLIRGLKK